jgi:hypothetical protein
MNTNPNRESMSEVFHWAKPVGSLFWSISKTTLIVQKDSPFGKAGRPAASTR